ncbi:GntR family transcriptional regulator [Reinekea sp. G2M2-21]|jgi:DNA-binding transcriptional regulator YhcF (GntR family)|uniref:GntR family transcriptional regulator n=1 Tax=Reinekea sp. G2M2-21 TaxID=2788942 RepID=UPI0018AB6D8D|nr:GntR family transcriptional regulator [Reinekea sp. G2M2-21]
MIQFDSTSAIYLQVADYMSEKILTDEWSEEERIPSIREVASMVQVNPNTVMRSYAHLQENDVIYNKRGVGYFVSEQGKNKIKQAKREEFIDTKLPRLFHEAALLSVTPEELSHLYSNFLGDQQ